jgi:hypothetical protein
MNQMDLDTTLPSHFFISFQESIAKASGECFIFLEYVANLLQITLAVLSM